MTQAGTWTWEQAVTWLRNQPDKAQLVYDAYYDDPLERAAARYWHSEEWAAVRTLLAQRSGQALDVGAGRGIASYALARDGFSVVALEPDPSLLVGAGAIEQLAHSSQLPIRVLCEGSEVLPFADAYFDVVFARAALHHIQKLPQTVVEFRRVLKPGGVLLAIREHVVSTLADVPLFLDQHPLHRYYGGENALLLEEYTAAIETAGLHLDRVIGPLDSPVNYAPYTLATLQQEIACRASGGSPLLLAAAMAILRHPGVWPILRPLLSWFDNRPGRHYSFVALRT